MFTLDSLSSEQLYSDPNVFVGYAQGYADFAYFEKAECGSLEISPEKMMTVFYMTGRMKRMVKLFGNRINLDEVEHLLKSRFPDTSFVCLGLEDKYLVIACYGGQADEQAIKHFLFTELKMTKNVIKVQMLDFVPLTDNGKIDYLETQRLLGT